MPPTLVLPAALCATSILLCWLLSVTTKEYSWVDRIWSVLPPVYAWIYAADAELSPRSTLMAVLITGWGARLTFNFWRKGGYAKGGEDYRWAILRQKLPRWAWPIFNLGFISGYQNLLIFGFTLPAWYAASSEAPLGAIDALATVLFLALLIGETVADQQQWSFHQDKRAGRAGGEPFLRTGLFRYSRHPNFFCEQGQWWTLTLFPVAAGLPWLNPTLAGVVLLTLLFDGSVRFTESISAAKYPTYKDYQRRTSRQVPWFPRA